MPWVAAIAAVAQIGSTVIGGIQAGKERDKAQSALEQALAEINAVGAPPDLSKEILLEKFQQAGVLTPAMEQQINLGVSKVAGIQENQGLKDAQMSALETLQQRGKGGLTAQDRAAFNKIRGDMARESEAKRQQIIQNMQARGISGGGAELATQLAAQQAASQQASEEGDRIAAAASQNALQAMLQGGQLAGQIRGQDFDVARAKAAAEDAVNQFNTQNAVARQQRNIASQNQGQQFNLQNQQQLSNMNVQQGNQERYRQAEAARQYWADKLNLAQSKGNVLSGQVKQHNEAAKQTAQQYQDIGSGFGQIGGAFSGGGMPGMGGGGAKNAEMVNADYSDSVVDDIDDPNKYNSFYRGNLS